MILSLLVFLALSAWTQAPGVMLATGRFEEPLVATARFAPPHVTVWLPPSYDRGRRRYRVVYMNDGQNLFFPARSGFGKVWAADHAVLGLVATRRIAPVIIVGVDNPGAARYGRYFPQRLYEMADPATKAALAAQVKWPIQGDAYLDYLTLDLKPQIDRRYRTLSDPAHTAIVGSSMGGLISCYAFVERPRVFGRAGCVSTHWLLAMPEELPQGADILGLWRRYLDARLGRPAGRRLWMDHGDQTLDAHYGPWQAAIDRDLFALRWRKGRDFESRTFPGAAHEENAWAARLPQVFAWLLK